jgi:prolyl-tRNA synthetase
MRWSQTFIPTVRQAPQDAVAPSHVLMIRAGLIRQVAAGSYAYLPIGYRALRKVEAIVREEMNRAGAIELNMPALQPLELWQETRRDAAMGNVLMRVADKPYRRDSVLAPTHEECVTDIVRAFVGSYKQLPITLYQIQTKFRDEERPKSGVLRTREFLMKDAYSFDTSMEGLDASFHRMYQAYCRIFTRCGLPYIVVESESGPIGGDASNEFMVLSSAGEDLMVMTEDGSYAANLERAAVAPLPETPAGTLDEIKPVHTPGLSTIEQVSRFLKCRPEDMIKTIIYQADDGQPLVALVRGDHEVNEGKLARAARVGVVEPAAPPLIEKVTGAAVGFAGPVALKARIITDQAVSIMHNAVTGANKTDYHVTGVNPGRDFTIEHVEDIRLAAPGDRAPNGQPLVFNKCIEVGHVFKLGTKYSDAMKAQFLDEHGKSRPAIMGCYGIGVNRIMAAAIESHHDEEGICWPTSIAPFQVVVLLLDYQDAKATELAERIHDELAAAGIDVLLDDRPQRPGPKFKDADLIGFPIRVVIGQRVLSQGQVEIQLRETGESLTVPPDECTTKVHAFVAEQLKTLNPDN